MSITYVLIPAAPQRSNNKSEAMSAQKPVLRFAGHLAVLTGLAVILLDPAPSFAKEPQVVITPESELRFGAFMVFGSGSRTVSAMGNVTDVALVPMEGSAVRPARFTLSYDRGNESRHVLDIELELIMSPPTRVRVRGVEAQLSGYETDLPGSGRVTPDQPIRVRLNQCRQRICSVSFNVGGRLDVTRQYGGASLVIPIPVHASVVSVERQRK